MDKDNFYLSYSGRKCFLTCPKQYWFKYVIKEKVYSDPKDSLFGLIIGKVFEWFYEKKFWSYQNPTGLAISSIKDATELIFLKKDYAKGSDYYFEQDLNEKLVKYIPLGLDVIKKRGLLTQNSQAELDLSINYSLPNSSSTVRFVGIADFVHYNSLTDVWIYDGKAYKEREKYVDSSQLTWYATLHYIKYHVAPSRLGFIYWMFPNDPVSYVDYDSDSMRLEMRNTIEVVNKIFSDDFNAFPSDGCTICSYRSVCEDGKDFLSKKRSQNRVVIDDSIFDIENVT